MKVWFANAMCSGACQDGRLWAFPCPVTAAYVHALDARIAQVRLKASRRAPRDFPCVVRHRADVPTPSELF
jgi:hypothetical protein